MRIVLLAIALIFAGAVQVGYLHASIVLALVYSAYLFYGFRTGTILALIGGVVVDAARAGFMGSMSLLYLLMLGVVEVMTSSRESVHRGVWVDALILVVLSAIESMFVGFSFPRVLYSFGVFVIIYAIMSWSSGGYGGIVVRRNA